MKTYKFLWGLADAKNHINKEDANLLFQLIAMRYEKTSTIITTNIEFSKWGDVLNDSTIAAAILDRLLHHCTIINIDELRIYLTERK